MLKLFTVAILIFSISIFSKSVSELNEDGSVKFIELSSEQQKGMESMKKDIQFFQKKLSPLVAYMIKNKPSQVKDGNFVKKEIGFTEGQKASRDAYVVNGDTFITMNGDSIDTLKFTLRKGTINPKTNPAVFTRVIENKFNEQGAKEIKLRVFHYPLAYGEENPVEVYDVDSIPDPIERMRMVRFYKENVRKLVRELENIVEHDSKRKNLKIWKTLNEVGG